MDDCLLPGCDNVRLATIENSVRCAYTAETIDNGLGAVRFEQLRNNFRYRVHVDIGAVDDLVHALEQFDPDAHEPGSSLAPSDRITYHRNYLGSMTCFVCDEDIEKDAENANNIQFADRQGHHLLWLHLDCRHRLADGLVSVWEHADGLLAERV